ncbi:hypothetical protein CkaCkLH20_07419 [Colletotrichum karsti]|uniref:Uncharacterized protein n=1 Tax=Colletotrichum karsti TaxID=1095194 RepID=A0A9P6I0P4_9PEZI|nr:uncharacterized protein CkaCkLH20_07419 [Colletotrichum karsti]KAF9875153.1 hypothetical protein CkaCkLH20_07419 [Colletotrichum karsti]
MAKDEKREKREDKKHKEKSSSRSGKKSSRRGSSSRSIMNHGNETTTSFFSTLSTLPSAWDEAEDDYEEPSYGYSRVQRTSPVVFWRVGAVAGAAAVGLGAFGAQGLKHLRITNAAKIATWSAAAYYQLVHSVALLIARKNPIASGFFTTGMMLFSGSLYALVIKPELKFLNHVTPVGGGCLVAGWLALGLSKGRIGFD